MRWLHAVCCAALAAAQTQHIALLCFEPTPSQCEAAGPVGCRVQVTWADTLRIAFAMDLNIGDPNRITVAQECTNADACDDRDAASRCQLGLTFDQATLSESAFECSFADTACPNVDAAGLLRTNETLGERTSAEEEATDRTSWWMVAGLAVAVLTVAAIVLFRHKHRKSERKLDTLVVTTRYDFEQELNACRKEKTRARGGEYSPPRAAESFGLDDTARSMEDPSGFKSPRSPVLIRPAGGDADDGSFTIHSEESTLNLRGLSAGRATPMSRTDTRPALRQSLSQSITPLLRATASAHSPRGRGRGTLSPQMHNGVLVGGAISHERLPDAANLKSPTGDDLNVNELQRFKHMPLAV